MYTKRNLVTAILAAAILLLIAVPARAATPEQIEAAIDAGVDWLIANQNVDGSWGDWEQVAQTGLAVVKLQDRARELPTNEYDEAIQAGLDYIFGQATVDPYGVGSGICFAAGGHETYNTGIAMMAVANDGDLSQVVDVAGSDVDGMTHGQVLRGNVDFFVWSQNPDGGWRYAHHPQESDQSNTGYVVLGLGYAENAGIDTSAVAAGLIDWIDAIQDPVSGGSRYTPTWDWVNVLKTGNLIFEMTFVGGHPGFDAAIAYIEAHWQDTNQDPGWGYNIDPAGYQAMYCLMKGLEYSGVDLIDTDGDSESDDDWYNQEPTASPSQDFASVLVAQQNADGSWPATNWGDTTLCTAWALLTLQKVTIVHAIEVPVDIKPTSCPNPVNLKSKGVLPVAVLGNDEFDVTLIDPATVVLSREGIVDENGEPIIVPPLRWAYEDVATPFEGELCDCHTLGADGYLDLTLKFSIPELVDKLNLNDVAGGTIPLTLTGNLIEELCGTPIRGEDCVWVLREKGK